MSRASSVPPRTPPSKSTSQRNLASVGKTRPNACPKDSHIAELVEGKMKCIGPNPSGYDMYLYQSDADKLLKHPGVFCCDKKTEQTQVNLQKDYFRSLSILERTKRGIEPNNNNQNYNKNNNATAISPKKPRISKKVTFSSNTNRTNSGSRKGPIKRKGSWSRKGLMGEKKRSRTGKGSRTRKVSRKRISIKAPENETPEQKAKREKEEEEEKNRKITAELNLFFDNDGEGMFTPPGEGDGNLPPPGFAVSSSQSPHKSAK